MHKGRDQALINWARLAHRFMRIDRNSEWNNPFLVPDDGNQDDVVRKFATLYLPNKNGLLMRIQQGELRGKVLGCWCHPRLCHGHVLAVRSNSLIAPQWRVVTAVHPDRLTSERGAG
jgi:hypothetical protein